MFGVPGRGYNPITKYHGHPNTLKKRGLQFRNCTCWHVVEPKTSCQEFVAEKTGLKQHCNAKQRCRTSQGFDYRMFRDTM